MFSPIANDAFFFATTHRPKAKEASPSALVSPLPPFLPPAKDWIPEAVVYSPIANESLAVAFVELPKLTEYSPVCVPLLPYGIKPLPALISLLPTRNLPETNKLPSLSNIKPFLRSVSLSPIPITNNASLSNGDLSIGKLYRPSTC